MLLTIIWYLFHNYFWPRSWPQPPEIGLGLEVLASFNITDIVEMIMPPKEYIAKCFPPIFSKIADKIGYGVNSLLYSPRVTRNATIKIKRPRTAFLISKLTGIHIKGVISEGQTTQTRLCSRTIDISEKCLRPNTNVFEFCFTNNSNSPGRCLRFPDGQKWRMLTFSVGGFIVVLLVIVT